MPNIKSAIKRDAISKARRLRNLSNRSRLNTARKTFLSALENGDAAARETALRAYSSEIDKAAKKGAIAKNGASRRKSRAAALAAKAAAKA
ncbi:MAG: 30S ribosomal protein S20 [Kiritimatiellae bacterium]|nr:30S ribosomal protein S20 [Kiritimatiellia bacterium]